MESLTRLILRSIEAHESACTEGPTVDELAEDLGIPRMLGHQRLSERLHRQVVLGRVYSDGTHIRLTQTGRLVASRSAE